MSVEQTLTNILHREGWPEVTNKPSDKGGLTKGGVTFTEYNRWLKQKGKDPIFATDFPALTENDARAFMLDDIAGPLVGIEVIDPALFEALFDWAETSGPSIPTRALQAALRALGADVGPVDGNYGAKTSLALRSLAAGALGQIPEGGTLGNLRRTIAKSRVEFYVRLALRDHAVAEFRKTNPTTDLENVYGWVVRGLEFL